MWFTTTVGVRQEATGTTTTVPCRTKMAVVFSPQFLHVEHSLRFGRHAYDGPLHLQAPVNFLVLLLLLNLRNSWRDQAISRVQPVDATILLIYYIPVIELLHETRQETTTTREYILVLLIGHLYYLE